MLKRKRKQEAESDDASKKHLMLNAAKVSELKDVSNWKKRGNIYYFKGQPAFKVKTSQIPGAGDGLYSLQDIKRNHAFTFYDGKDIGPNTPEVFQSPKFIRMRLDERTGQYIQGMGGRFIDGRKSKTGAQYINDISNRIRWQGQGDPPRRLKRNARQSHSGSIVSLDSGIKKGDEIFMDYGPEYWRYEHEYRKDKFRTSKRLRQGGKRVLLKAPRRKSKK